MKEVVVEIFNGGQWLRAAVFEVPEREVASGYRARGYLTYDIDYVFSRMGNERVVDRVGCLYPVNFDLYDGNNWPAFLLDLLPTGAARDAWLKKLGLRDDDDSSWWPLLKFAAGNPPGNLRITGAAEEAKIKHLGFKIEEIIEKNVDFIEYAEANGAMVSGASDVQGQAPKFLLVQDRNGRWHAEGALPDGQATSYSLVKFPRGKKQADRQVLRNEAPYYEVARAFGIRTASPLEFREDALFVRRFDRKVTQEGVKRYGLESMASVCGVSEFGARISHDRICKRIHRYATNSRQEILEYIRRDVLNIALRNTDNHGRNTAFLKDPSGVVALSPLFDFAPMFLDPEGIARSSRWEAEGTKDVGLPNWGRVAEDLEREIGYPSADLRHWLSAEAPKVERLPDIMNECGVEPDVIEKLARRIDDVARMLKDALPRL